MRSEGFKIEKIKVIKLSKGNLFKVFSRDHKFFKKFGEAYISEIYPGKFKGWKYHEKRTQIISVINGKVRFYFKTRIQEKPKFIDLSFPRKFYLLKIEPKIFYSFECKSKYKSQILNFIDEVVK